MSSDSFSLTLRDLLIDRGITQSNGNPDYRAFTEDLEGVSYESLRKARMERDASPKILESVAYALDIPPTTFREYRRQELLRLFDSAVVGEEPAYRNVERATLVLA